MLGREGGGADIVVRDKSVSKRHAKVYERGGKWFLEDLQSANGTYVDEQPVTRPVNMRPGMSFSLSNYHFEVMGLEAGSSAPTKARGAPPPKAAAMAEEWDADGGYPDETAPPPEDEWAPEAPAKGNRAPLNRGKKGPEPKANGNGKGAASGGRAKSAVASAQKDFDEGSGGVVAQIPKSIGYYLKAVPLMLVNPVGFIRSSIDDMKWPAMKPMELLPWGLVAGLFQWGLGIGAGTISTVTAMIQAKSFAIGAIIALVTGSVVGLVIAVVVAVVGAFLFHPVMGFIIRLLKGESDEVSRSNYFICVMTANVLVGLNAAGVGIASVFALIPVVGRFGAILPLLGGIIGTFYLLLTAYFWFKHFQVMKWVPIVILVLALLNALSGVWGVIGVVRATIAGAGAGGSAGVITLTPEQAQAYADAQAAMAAGKELTAEQQAALATGAAAMASAGGTGSTGTGTEPTPEPAETGSSATPAGTAVAMAKTPVPTPTARPGTTPGATTNPGVSVAPIPGGLTPYQKWAAKRDAVEKAIADDPTILRTNREVFSLYQQYHRAAFAVKTKYAKQSKDPAISPVVNRMIDAETFEATGQIVDQLYARISK